AGGRPRPVGPVRGGQPARGGEGVLSPRWTSPIPCCASMVSVRVPCAPQRWLASAVISAALGGGCVFHPPPPLPEELAARRAEEAARKAQVNAGEAMDPDGEEDG